MKHKEFGDLYIVSTPIGNLDDISFRAKEVLSQADLILAEDTRRSAKLLAHYQIKTPTSSFHDHSSKQKQESLLGQLKQGKNLLKTYPVTRILF